MTECPFCGDSSNVRLRVYIYQDFPESPHEASIKPEDFDESNMSRMVDPAGMFCSVHRVLIVPDEWIPTLTGESE